MLAAKRRAVTAAVSLPRRCKRSRHVRAAGEPARAHTTELQTLINERLGAWWPLGVTSDSDEVTIAEGERIPR